MYYPPGNIKGQFPTNVLQYPSADPSANPSANPSDNSSISIPPN
jgi:hypothetical protein